MKRFLNWAGGSYCLRPYRLGLFIAFAALSSSCATIVSDDSYAVTVTSTPSGATAVLKDENDIAVRGGTTPFAVTLDASKGYFKCKDYVAEFELDGHKKTLQVLDADVDEWIWGNIIFGGWGLIGALLIDPITGAACELPGSVHGMMTPQPGASKARVSAARANRLAELKQLAELRSSGALSEDEFRSLKVDLMGLRFPVPLEEPEFVSLDPESVPPRSPEKDSVALVIGIERYRRLPEAPYAREDASLFQDYAHRSLGVPRNRVVQVLDENADYFGMKDGIRRAGSYVDSKTDLYVFFAGHGFSSGEGVPYLIPHDGDAKFLDQLDTRSEMFTAIDDLGARTVTVFLDTCYSGRSRSGGALAKGMRPLVIAKTDDGVPEGFTVLSAASAGQFSADLPAAKHGLFSYYLMRGLQGDADLDGDRTITVSELHSYVGERVDQQAARLGREQTPELFGDGNRVLVEFDR